MSNRDAARAFAAEVSLHNRTAPIAKMEQEIGRLADALLAMSGEMQEAVGAAIRREFDRIAAEGEGAAAAIGGPATPDAGPDQVFQPQEDAAGALRMDMGAAQDLDFLRQGNVDLIRAGMHELVDRIELTRAHVSTLTPAVGESDQILAATTELGSVVKATETATQTILENAEAMQEVVDDAAETLDPALYGRLSESIINIFTACGFQDLTGQRISASINTLLHVEAELKRLIELWEIEEGTAKAEIIRNHPDDQREDKHLLHGPQTEGDGMSQDDIDSMLS